MRVSPPAFGLRSALAVLVLIAIAPVFAIVVRGSLAEQGNSVERAQASVLSLADLASAQQERLIDDTRLLLAAIANSPPVYSGELRPCAEYIRRLQMQYPREYGAFGVIDADGRLTCRAEAPVANVNSADRPFFRNAVRTGRFSVGEFTVSRASGRPVLVFGLPVYREDEGKSLRGVAYAAIDLRFAEQQLRSLALAQGVSLIVADANGVVLAAAGPNAAAVGSPIPLGFLADAVAAGKTVSGSGTLPSGQEWMFAVRPAGRPAEGRLFIASMVSRNAVIASAAQRLREQLAAVGLVAMLGVLLAWWFGDRVLVRPMARMLGRVEALSRQQTAFDDALPAKGVHELRDLERRFLDMARSLAERSIQRDLALSEMEGQNRLLESVLESMVEGVMVIAPTGRFIHLNAAARKILPGLADINRRGDSLSSTPQELGVSELDTGAPLSLEDSAARVALAGRTVDSFRYRVHGPLSAGEEKIIHGHARPIVAAGGSHFGALVVFSDITDAWRAERELKERELEYRTTLERRVEERTRELAVSNRELESFSYSVSHDLRAPLQVIDGFGRALLARHASQLDPQGMHYLDRIRDNTRHMSALIDDLLALARVTRAELRREPVDLALKSAQVVDRLRQRTPEREVRIEIQDTIPCVGDPGLLGVVMENLIENAWKFTARTPQARISVGVAREEGEDVYFVADNGAGFDMTYASKLFNAFQRLHASSEFEGTGVGLATVHRVVTRHGGRVWVEAAPGEGATFRFTLKA